MALKVTRKAKAVELPNSITDLPDELLKNHITTNSVNFYHDQPKELQVEAVSCLVRGQNCFVRAGTGFGKTRISEMFFNLYTTKAVVLVLNPLDSLGDDQVREKCLVNISAINLNKMTLNFETVMKIKKGDYSFVYLSPEVFLNSSLFTEMFFSSEFQNLLALIVVDEAHMVYLWGLVASKQSKRLNSFDRHQDRSVFRPSYGSMCDRLMATNNVPLLLMSATCRPVVLEAITTNLKLQPADIKLIDGELTRPEIRLIRISMQSTLKSCDDLLRIYAPHTMVPSEKVVPTIIYSGTRNATFQVMKVVHEARGTKWHEYDPEDSFIRRFHSVTGDEDKTDNMADYAEGRYPVISATMALGLGQNLKRVRCVIHMGRGDPSSIVQMVGRCGRDGNPGLGLMFMEPIRKKGINEITGFVKDKTQNDDDRMDALAITPVCLRIALTVDNQNGYIPLTVDDPTYQAEVQRELKLGFETCRCSNCDPTAAEAVVNLAQQLTVDNFDSILKNPLGTPKDNSIVTLTRKAKPRRPKGTCRLAPLVAEDLIAHLVREFEDFYARTLGPSAEFLPSDFFGISHATAVVGAFDQIRDVIPHNTELLERLMGGEFFPNQTNWVNDSISNWMGGAFYQDVLNHEAFVVSEERRLREEIEATAGLLQIEKEAWTAAEKANARAITAEAARVRKEASDQAKRKRAKEVAEEKERKRQVALLKKQAEQDRKRFETELKKAQKLQRQEEDAAQKQAARVARNKAAADSRAAVAATKAEEKKIRKETKENNKKRASTNRDLQGIKNLKRRATQEDTRMVLGFYNASVVSAGVGPSTSEVPNTDSGSRALGMIN